jgi:Ribonuclease G/E
MADDHFSREAVERFFRSELSREENRDFVRHLLKRCPQCSGLLQEISQRQNFLLLIRGLEDAALREPDRPGRVLNREHRFVDPEARAGPEAL